METNIDELFRNRLLRKIPVDLEKVNSSIRIAELKLEEAEKLFEADFFSNVILSAYTSMFHASRALLYILYGEEPRIEKDESENAILDAEDFFGRG